ncbi:MAG: aminoglycoside phosphotransferase family protein [Bauldia sp.]
MDSGDERPSRLPARTARLVLVTPDGVVVGCLPPVEVSTPWWQDIGPVVQAARDRHGIDITVLRLLEAELDRPPGGCVTYLAEVAGPAPAEPWDGVLDDHPLRPPYARPGGPAADIRWAEAIIRARGLIPTDRPAQLRSWNLSSIWRLPTDHVPVWLKVVPPFFAHEGKVLAALAGEPVPTLLGNDGGRTLLAEIPGDDLYAAALPQLLAMVALLVGLQRPWLGRVNQLLALGLPDWRAPALRPAIEDVVERSTDALPKDARQILERFLSDLPRRFAEIAACGIGDTLVHGDFHPGNFRGDWDRLFLLDWGDSGVGHPLLDQPAFLERIGGRESEAVRGQWTRLWLEAAPGSDPARAATLLAPIAAARQAVIYQRFLDSIEPAEHPYHRADPALWLQRTAELARPGPV